MPDLIDAYLTQFDQALRYDPRLARRVRAEVASHLREAVDSGRAEAAAPASFGDPRRIARDFAAAELPGVVRATWRHAALLAVVAFAMMRARSLAIPPRIGEGLGLATIDRTAFLMALLLFGWAWWSTLALPPVALASRIRAPLAAALGFMIASVAANCLRTLGAGGEPPLILATAAVEMGMIAAIVASLHRVRLHAAHVAGSDGGSRQATR